LITKTIVPVKIGLSSKTNTFEKRDIVQEFGVLKKDISSFKKDVIKWMFIFWASQIAITFGLLIHYIKK
jgi:hypothetical protein